MLSKRDGELFSEKDVNIGYYSTKKELSVLLTKAKEEAEKERRSKLP